MTKKVRRVITYLDYLKVSTPESWKAIESRGKSEIYHSFQQLTTIRSTYEGGALKLRISLILAYLSKRICTFCH